MPPNRTTRTRSATVRGRSRAMRSEWGGASSGIVEFARCVSGASDSSERGLCPWRGRWERRLVEDSLKRVFARSLR